MVLMPSSSCTYAKPILQFEL